jgi:hypothetical protein
MFRPKIVLATPHPEHNKTNIQFSRESISWGFFKINFGIFSFTKNLKKTKFGRNQGRNFGFWTQQGVFWFENLYFHNCQQFSTNFQKKKLSA